MRNFLDRTYSVAVFFWLTAAAIMLALYVLCLRFLFPHYFAPLSAFHVDFYTYAATGAKSFSDLIRRFPRPVSYVAMKILAAGGFSEMLAGGIAIALLNVLLTLALVRSVFQVRSAWVLAPFVFYTALLFAHPEFYIEHRHDLPAEVSYLFLALSLLAWMAFVRRRNTDEWGAKIMLLAAAVVCSVFFAFAKETYFAAALCLAGALALAKRSDRLIHSCFLVFLLAVEFASFRWNLHIGGPFVNPGAAAADPYRISFAPASVAHCYLFYLRYLLNPGLIVLVFAMLAAGRSWPRLILSAGFVLAGLSAFAPHAILPNHLFPEYAWAGAPLLLAPVLLLDRPEGAFDWRWIRFAAAALLAVFALAGPYGYRTSYRTDREIWLAGEDRKGASMVASFPTLQAIRGPARVLVVGLEDASIPWECGDFTGLEFGDRILWSVVLPAANPYRWSSRLVAFPHADEVRLEDFDRVVTYDSTDHLIAIRDVSANPAAEARAEVIVPALAPWLAASRSRPHDADPLLQSAAVALNWGLWADAERFLNNARNDGAAEQTIQPLMANAQNGSHAAKAAQTAQITARPSHLVQRDGSGLGETELFWTVPDGVAYEVHVNAPDGPLLAAGVTAGHARTAKWVRNGMQFFLQDVSGGKPLTQEHTLARVKVEVTT